MTSEIRTNSLKSRAGLSTVTFTDSGPMFSGITTFVDNSGFNLGTGSSIFTPASNTLTFGTNSNERLRIDSSGQLGIGTNSPKLPLHVHQENSNASFAHFTNTTTGVNANQGVSFGLDSNEDATIYHYGSKAIRFATGGTEKVRITSAGDINVHNTTAASSTDPVTLDLGGQFTANASITQANLKLKLYHNGSNGDAQGITASASGLSYVSSHTTDHIFYTVPSSINSLVERVRIGSNGYVNIGTGTAQQQLTVQNSAQHSLVRVISSPTAESGIDFGDTDDGDQGKVRYNNVDSYMRFDVSASEKLRITSAGNLGIGITNPAALTHIYDSTNTSTATEQFRISGGNRTADNIETGFRFFTESPSINGNRHIRFTSNGNTGLIIQPIETSTGNAAVDRTIDLCPSGGRVEIGANGSVFGRLSVSSLDGVQAGGSAIQVMNTAAGSGDGSTTNLILRSVNSAGTQWSMAEYRAQYHMFSNQGTEVLRTQVSGDYGSVETRNAKNGYGGYGIVVGGVNNVFMGDQNGAGLYNDTDNGWYIYGAKGGDTYLYSNGSPTFRSYVTGDYGAVQTTGSKNGWGGYSVNGNFNFMADTSNGACGIYNDIENEWMAYFARNGAFILYNNGVGVLTSDGSGPIVPGGHHFKINAGTWTGEHVGKIQYHSNNLYNQYSSYWIARNASGTNTFTVDSSGNFSSDARKKENITTVTDALTKVSQLRGVEFNWKEKYGSKEDMGLIAQEVETVFPRLISDSPDPEGAEKENEDGTPMKMMNYNGLFAVTVEAIKELKSKIETLEGESLKLKEENAALRERVTNLEGE